MTLSKDTAITIIVLGYVGLAEMIDCGNSGEWFFSGVSRTECGVGEDMGNF